MERDGPLASLLAFLGVVATVLLIFRRGLATPFVIGSLVVGVLWLLARHDEARHQDQLRELHRLPHHLRHRRRLRRQRHGALHPRRRARRGGGGARNGRRRRALLVDDDRSATRRCSSPRTSACSSSACWPCSARSACLTTAVVVLPAVLMLVAPSLRARDLPEILEHSATAGVDAESGGNADEQRRRRWPGAARVEPGPEAASARASRARGPRGQRGAPERRRRRRRA